MSEKPLKTMAELLPIIEKAKNGDQEAFGYLYTTYLTPIYRFIYYRVKNEQEAEDLTQTVFLKAWNAVGSYEHQGHQFTAWLYTIAKNTVTDYWKKKKDILIDEPEITLGHIPSDSDPMDDIQKQQLSEAVRTLLKKLSEDQQMIITLKFIDELSNKEIAAITGKNEDAIRALQYRALKALSEHCKHISL